MCNTTHSFAQHDSFICATCRIHLCNIAHSLLCTWLTHVCDLTPSYTPYDSFIVFFVFIVFIVFIVSHNSFTECGIIVRYLFIHHEWCHSIIVIHSPYVVSDDDLVFFPPSLSLSPSHLSSFPLVYLAPWTYQILYGMTLQRIIPHTVNEQLSYDSTHGE